MWRIVGPMIVIGVVLPQTTFGEEKDAPMELKEFCKDHSCRRNVSIKLRTGDDDIDVTLPLYWPAIEEGRISLLPGEELATADPRDRALGSAFVGRQRWTGVRVLM